MVTKLIGGCRELDVYAKSITIIALLWAGRCIFHSISTSLSHKATFTVLGNIRKRCCEKLSRVPLGYVLDTPSGSLKNIMVERVDTIETTMAHIIPEFTSNLLVPLGLLVYLFVMNEESEKFRKITMKVLTMQLNSITIMDFVAYGGAAVGIILAILEFRADAISLAGCFAIIMLSADFFIPMRQLGSFFHVAMNGMAASDKIFRLLDLPETEPKTAEIQPESCDIIIHDLHFSYEDSREVLHGVLQTLLGSKKHIE